MLSGEHKELGARRRTKERDSIILSAESILLETEKAYVECLGTVISDFISCAGTDRKQLLTKQEATILFSSIGEIHEAHTAFLVKLRHRDLLKRTLHSAPHRRRWDTSEVLKFVKLDARFEEVMQSLHFYSSKSVADEQEHNLKCIVLAYCDIEPEPLGKMILSLLDDSKESVRKYVENFERGRNFLARLKHSRTKCHQRFREACKGHELANSLKTPLFSYLRYASWLSEIQPAVRNTQQAEGMAMAIQACKTFLENMKDTLRSQQEVL